MAFDNIGPLRDNASANWVEQDCLDWPNNANGINNKHQDADGNGIINSADIDVLIQNLGKAHNLTGITSLTNSMQFNLIPDFEANNANSSDGVFEYDFYVEDTGNNISAYGISASIFFGSLNVVSASIDTDGSALNPLEHLQYFDANKNTLHFSLTKTNGINTTLSGPVCKVIVQIVEIETGETFSLNVNSGGVMQANGTLNKVTGITVQNESYESEATANSIALSASALHANCENGGSAVVNAFGGSGNYCYLWNNGASTQQIANLSPGIYSVLVCDENRVANGIEIEVQGQFIPIYDEDGNNVPCSNNTTQSTVLPSGIFLGQAQINNAPAQPGDRLVANDENDNTSGFDLLSFFDGIAYINLPIYGDDIETPEDEGINVGEYFTLQLYDASENAYYNYTSNGQLVEFTGWENTNGAPISEYNNSDDIYNFNAPDSGEQCSQSLNLNAGWNLISFNTSQANNILTNVFANLIAINNLEKVTGFNNGAKVFDPNQPPFLNTLQTIDDGFGYWVKLTNADVLNAQGGCISVDYKKPMDAGWNLIAYPPNVSQSPNTYFDDEITVGNLEKITGFNNGAKVFDPNQPPFLNTLNELENGFGYWVKVTNSTAKTASNFTNVFSFINGTSNLPIGEQVAILNEIGETVARMDVLKDGYLMTTPIYGDDETTITKEFINKGENLRFSWNNQIVDFTTTFKGDYGIEKIDLQFKLKNSLATTVNVFPNPLAHKANIFYNLEKSDNVTIVLFNASGKQLSTIVENQIQKAGQHQVELNVNDLDNGIYYLQLQNIESNVIQKLVISK